MMQTMKNETKKGWTPRDTILLGFNVAVVACLFLLFNDRLPDIMASHYNAAGEPDRSMAKWGFWLLNAGIVLAIPLLFHFRRFADARNPNNPRIGEFVEISRWAISLFLHGVFLMVIFDNLGYDVPMVKLLLGGMGILWFLTGNKMGLVRPNLFIGIRTPWALSDETNWKLTHRLGARLWVIAGLIMFACAWFVTGPWAAAVLLACTFGSALIPVAYSFILQLRKEKA